MEDQYHIGLLEMDGVAADLLHHASSIDKSDLDDIQSVYSQLTKEANEAIRFSLSVSQSSYATDLLKERLHRANSLLATFSSSEDPVVREKVSEYFMGYDEDATLD